MQLSVTHGLRARPAGAALGQPESDCPPDDRINLGWRGTLARQGTRGREPRIWG